MRRDPEFLAHDPRNFFEFRAEGAFQLRRGTRDRVHAEAGHGFNLPLSCSDHSPSEGSCIPSPSTGFGSRVATSHYIHNHIGSLAAAGEAFAKALLLGGVTKRFPQRNFAFLEGGVAWASELYAGLPSHASKRNAAQIGKYDPTELDGAALAELFDRHAEGRMRGRPGVLAAGLALA